MLAAADAEVTPLASIDPTRSAARVSASDDAGEALGDACAGLGRALVAVSSELVGVCERALEMTVAYVKERKQFGVPVGAYQAVSHRCAQMLLETEKARSTTAFAAWTADADPERLAEAAAMAKAAASDAAREVTASAIQAHGGIGFTWEADVHWLFKRAQVDAVLLGGAGTPPRAAGGDPRGSPRRLGHRLSAAAAGDVPLRGLPARHERRRAPPDERGAAAALRGARPRGREDVQSERQRRLRCAAAHARRRCASAIEEGLRERLGYAVPTFVRSAQEMARDRRGEAVPGERA